MTRSTRRFSADSFAVYQDTVVLPNGAKLCCDVVRRPEIAVIVAMPTPGVVVLIKQFRHLARDYIWEVPAGKILKESPEESAFRELEEEAGYRAGQIERLATLLLEPGFTDEIVHIFAAYELVATNQRCEADEIIEVSLTPLEEAIEMIWTGKIRDAKSVLGLLFLRNHLSKPCVEHR